MCLTCQIGYFENRLIYVQYSFGIKSKMTYGLVENQGLEGRKSDLPTRGMSAYSETHYANCEMVPVNSA